MFSVGVEVLGGQGSKLVGSSCGEELETGMDFQTLHTPWNPNLATQGIAYFAQISPQSPL